MTSPPAGLVPLFDLPARQDIHLGHASPVTGLNVCAVCKASIVLLAAWCVPCPGWVDVAPAGMRLAELEDAPVADVEVEEAA